MRNPNQLWESLGDVDADETGHVLTRLFALYEKLLEKNPKDKEALIFFRNLDIALTQTAECNLNRR
jgi:hypothetical protein